MDAGRAPPAEGRFARPEQAALPVLQIRGCFSDGGATGHTTLDFDATGALTDVTVSGVGGEARLVGPPEIPYRLVV